MKPTKYERKGKTIFDLENKTKKVYVYHNEAKRASLEIQMAADGALGRGTLQLRK